MKRKEIFKNIVYAVSFILFISGVACSFYGLGFIIGGLDMSYTFLNEYEMNISIMDLNCEQKLIWEGNILYAVIRSISWVWLGFVLMLLSIITDLSFKDMGK